MKTFSISFFISLALMLLCTPLRGWSIHYATVAEIITYSLLTFFLLKKNTQHMGMCLLGIIIGRYVLDLPFRFIDFRGTLISLMVSMGSLLGILLGFTYFKVKRWIVLVVSAIVVFVFSFVLEPQWRDYVAYGSLPEGLNVSTFKVETANDSLEIASIHKKYVVLDFWSSSCGICRREFPLVQDLHEQIQQEKNEVFLTSVFVKYGDEQFADGQKILADYNCTFPIVSISGNDSILKYLNIQGFPEIIILDENKEVIFKGSLERAKKRIRSINK